MKDKIKILSNHVINQIAAGEVIQRPSSVAKELLENSIDAGSKNIHLIIKNSGKNLIKVIDDGSGMSKEDAKLCFEKHATSKIQNINDISNILTMGFRGEALASIASVSEVEMKTKKFDESIGTQVFIENSKINKITETACNNGTSIAVKNLFFNIPARKNFLKSDRIELKHIYEIFIQISLANPKIIFKLTNDNKVVFNLPLQNLKSRIIQIFGKKYNKKILEVDEQTSIVSISGFIVNPMEAKKTRGEQYFFVNNRFIKSSYLNHAVRSSMNDIINHDQYPSYFIFLKIDSNLIDVNVHPNKTEIKFEDEKSIYQILKSSCKRSIGLSSVQASLDFSSERSFEIPNHIFEKQPIEPKIKINSNYNPFKNNSQLDVENTKNFEKLFPEDDNPPLREIVDIDKRYCLFIVKNETSINILDKKRAVSRIIFEKSKKNFKNKKLTGQLLINAEKLDFNISDIQIIKDNLELFNDMGFKIIINGSEIILKTKPNIVEDFNFQHLFESFIEEIKYSSNEISERIISRFLKEIALKKSNNYLSSNYESLDNLIKNLLDCENPFIDLNGNSSVINIEPNKIFK